MTGTRSVLLQEIHYSISGFFVIIYIQAVSRNIIMEYYLIDYKGKHYSISDDIDEFDYSIGKINDKEIADNFLKRHVETCIYYGIAAYFGKNKELHKKINKLYNEKN